MPERSLRSFFDASLIKFQISITLKDPRDDSFATVPAQLTNTSYFVGSAVSTLFNSGSPPMTDTVFCIYSENVLYCSCDFTEASNFPPKKIPSKAVLTLAEKLLLTDSVSFEAQTF